MILKLGTQFGKDFEDYKNIEDGSVKNEASFLQYLEQKDPSLTRAERNKRFRSYLFNSILEDNSNNLKPLISTSNRSSNEQPLTIDMLSRSLFSCFLYTEPLSDDMLSDKYKRDLEFDNLLKLLNVLYDRSLSFWNSKASHSDQTQIKLKRIYSSKSIMAWSEIFRDAVCAKLDIYDGDEKAKPFYRELNDEDQDKIEQIFSRLYNWQLWISPRDSGIDTAIAGNKSDLKEWFRTQGLTTGFLMGAGI